MKEAIEEKRFQTFILYTIFDLNPVWISSKIESVHLLDTVLVSYKSYTHLSPLFLRCVIQ